MKRCGVCNSARRHQVDQALLANKSCRVVGRKFGFSHMTISRHERKCLAQTLALATEEEAHALLLAADILVLSQEAERLQRRSEQKGDLRTAVAAMRERRGLLELRARTAEVRRTIRADNVTFAVRYVNPERGGRDHDNQQRTLDAGPENAA